MKKRGKKIMARYVVLIIIVILIATLVIFSKTLSEDRKLNTFESLIKDTVTFAEKIVLTPFNYICDLVKDFNELKEIRKENDNLKLSIERIDAIET